MIEENRKLKINALTETEKHYKNLAEVYVHYYEDHLDRELKIFLAKGVIVEMESDLAKWHQKNKPNDTSKKQLYRLGILQKAIDVMGSLSSTNIHAKLTFNKLRKEIDSLEEENNELKETIKKLNQLIDETSE